MSEPDAERETPVLVALAQAIEAAKAEITGQADDQAAFARAQRAALMIRLAADEFARLRAVIAVRLVDEQGISLAKLGHMIGVSKPRAGQIVDHGRRIRAEESPRTA